MTRRTYTGLCGPGELEAVGPLVAARLRPTVQQSVHLLGAGEPADPFVQVRLLVDTGAVGSFVTIEHARRIGLRPISRELAVGIGGNVECPVYIAMLDLPVEVEGAKSGMMPVRVRLAGLERGVTSTFDGLLGRDFLRDFAYAYDGPSDRFLLSTVKSWRDR